MTDERIRVSTVVPLEPHEAFELFVEDVDAWWIKDDRHRFGPRPQAAISFRDEAFVETDPDGTVRELGRVLEWKAGERLRFELRHREAPQLRSEVDVRFEPHARGTEVTLEHHGWQALRPDHPLRRGLRGRAFADMVSLRWANLLGSLRRRALAR